MSILIKGMKMPKNCAECDISQAYDIRSTWCPLTFTTQAELKRQDNCPLIELPPHGRLIDADALKRVIKDESDFLEANCGEDEHSFKIGSLGAFARARGCIREAPTIIEKESE